jgi:hypothetical protein
MDYIVGYVWRGVDVRWRIYSCYCTWSHMGKFDTLRNIMTLKCSDIW